MECDCGHTVSGKFFRVPMDIPVRYDPIETRRVVKTLCPECFDLYQIDCAKFQAKMKW